MRVAYFDCFSGASGDMVLGALLDAGLSMDALRRDVGAFGLPGVEIAAEKTTRCGVAGTSFQVMDGSAAAHSRKLRDILDLIGAAELPDRVRADATRVFNRLAEVEAAIHGVSPEAVHFHELGAVDSVVDIVGAAAGLARLEIDQVLFSRLSVGRGYLECAHGRLPAPAPATAKLIEGFQVSYGVAEGEMLTPTGAAILTTLGQQAEPEELCPSATGYGAGRRDRESLPNLLRVTIGDSVGAAPSDVVWVLETNLDDCSPEVIGYALDRIWAAGALDVFATPIQMKKSRPGVKVTAIVPRGRVSAVEDVLFRETSTFGVRRYEVQRSTLQREIRTVGTPYGQARVKMGIRGGRAIACEPEYEDCRRIAEAKGLALREVMAHVKRVAEEGVL